MTKSHYRTDSTRDKNTNVSKINLEPDVQFVKDCWETWDQHWSSKFSKFETYYDQWIGKPPERDEEWQAQFHKKLSWQGEKTLVSRFHTALFPVAAPIDYDTSETPDELQGILAKSMVAHWFKIGKFSKEFLSGMRPAAIYGTGVFEDDWFLKTERIPFKQEREIPDFRAMVDQQGKKLFDEQGNIRSEKIGTKKVMMEDSRRRVVEDRYRVRKSNIFAWRIHPDKLTDEDDLPVVKQEFMNYEQLVEVEAKVVKLGITDKFENLEKIKDDIFKPSEKDIERHQKDGSFNDKKNPRLELLHYWGLATDGKNRDPQEESGEKEARWICIVNRKFRLINKSNPFWHKKSPMFHIIWTEDEKPSWYGIGLVEIGKSAEDRANENVNIRTDMKKKMVKGGGQYNALDKKIKKRDLTKNIPGLWRPVSDIRNGYTHDVIPQLTPDDYKEEETAVNDYREITGATSSLAPSEDKSQMPDTLGGMQLVLGQSIQRLKPDLQMMEMMGIRKMADRGFLLTMQFFTASKQIKIIASQDKKKQLRLQDMFTWSPQSITKKVNFHATGLSETVEKSQNIDKLMKYAAMTGKVPPLQAITNYQSIGKRIALWLGFEDVEEFVLMNPVNPYGPTQQGQQGQLPGQGAPGQPQGLPPEAIQQIAQRIGGQGAPPVNQGQA